jgi:hypothetical protein
VMVVDSASADRARLSATPANFRREMSDIRCLLQ